MPGFCAHLGKPQNLSFKESWLIWFVAKIAPRADWEVAEFSHPGDAKWWRRLGNPVAGWGGVVDPPVCLGCMALQVMWNCVPLGTFGIFCYYDSIDSKLSWVVALKCSWSLVGNGIWEVCVCVAVCTCGLEDCMICVNWGLECVNVCVRMLCVSRRTILGY